MKKLFSIVLCAAMLVSLLAGCGSAPSSSAASSGATSESAAAPESTGGETSADALQVAWTSDITTFDVHMTTDDYEIPLNIFDRLFEIQLNEDGSTELAKSLVADYSVSDDALTYDFTLRDDVKFSDGTPLTADDVAYTFTRMVAVESSQQEYLFESVEGYEEFTGSGNYHDAVLTGITVTDDTHFSITLSKPYAGFLNILASPACCIYSKAVVEAAGDAFGTDITTAVGSGAYTITSWTRDSGMTLELNPNYWGETPDFTEVNCKIIPDADTLSMMFQSGEVDILDCGYLDAAVVASAYKTAYADKIVSVNRLGTSYMALNAANEALADVNVRKAIQMAIDRQTIIDTLLNGDAVTVDGIYPAGLIGYSEDNQGWLTYDPEGAEQLLIDAGYTKDADGYYFTFEISNDNDNSTTRQNVIYAIAEQLQAVGINAVVQSYDHAAWLDMRKAGEIDAYVSTWTADYNDPDNFIATFWGGSGSTKGRSLNYENEDVMTRVSAATGIVDDDERLAEYAALEKQIVETDASWVPLYCETHLFVLSERVASFVPHWAGYSDYSFAGVKLA